MIETACGTLEQAQSGSLPGLLNKQKKDDDDDEDEDKRRKLWPLNVHSDEVSSKTTQKKKGRISNTEQVEREISCRAYKCCKEVRMQKDSGSSMPILIQTFYVQGARF